MFMPMNLPPLHKEGELTFPKLAKLGVQKFLLGVKGLLGVGCITMWEFMIFLIYFLLCKVSSFFTGEFFFY